MMRMRIAATMTPPTTQYTVSSLFVSSVGAPARALLATERLAADWLAADWLGAAVAATEPNIMLPATRLERILDRICASPLLELPGTFVARRRRAPSGLTRTAPVATPDGRRRKKMDSGCQRSSAQVRPQPCRSPSVFGLRAECIPGHSTGGIAVMS